MAGLTAARALAERGLRVLVLEARDRIGGRVHTLQRHDHTIELGAEFVHGRPPELIALIAEAGLEIYERDGSMLALEDGKLVDGEHEEGEAYQPLEDLRSFTGPDRTFAEYLDRHNVPADARRPIVGYVEGFNAANHRIISCAALGEQQKAEDDIEGTRVFCIRGGYAPLAEYLAQRIRELGGEVRLNAPAKSLEWKQGRVSVRCGDTFFTAPRCIISLPLGVLQSGALFITPEPGKALAATSRLRMGNARRLTLVFRSRFWETLDPQPAMQSLSFLLTFGKIPGALSEPFEVWWTPRPRPGNLLTGWVGGPRAEALAGISTADLTTRACQTLAEVFHMDEAAVRAQLLDSYSHDWQLDPYSCGAYSYIPVNALGAPLAMTEPITNTLYFAGEHTDITAHWGTVHAAIRSGLRAAAQLLGD